MKNGNEMNKAHQYRLSQAERLIESVRVQVGRRTCPAYVKNTDGTYSTNPAVDALIPARRRRQFLSMVYRAVAGFL